VKVISEVAFIDARSEVQCSVTYHYLVLSPAGFPFRWVGVFSACMANFGLFQGEYHSTLINFAHS